ncbi:MAG: hypothetical protein AB7S92_22110 [Parvibaculaceae bacterium]
MPEEVRNRSAGIWFQSVPLFILEAAFVIGWSSGFIGGRLVVELPSILQVLFWRFLIASLLLGPFLIQAARAGLTLKQLGQEILVGTLVLAVCLASASKQSTYVDILEERARLA